VSGEEEYSVTISGRGFTETVRGRTVEEVFRGVSKALSQHFPMYELVSGLIFKPDYERLFTKLRGTVTFLSGGEFVLGVGSEVSDLDTVLICLTAAYAGHELSLGEKDSLSISEIHDVIQASGLPYSRKTVNNRLSDLAKRNMAKRVGRGEYRVTELGVKHFLEQLIQANKEEG